MRHKAQLLLLLMLLVWVEGNGNDHDGTKSGGDERRQSKEESVMEDERDEYVYSEDIDSIRSKAVKIVPAPDLSKSEEGKWKDGDNEAGDVGLDLLSEPAKWIQRMIAEVEGVGNELPDEYEDEERIDAGEDEMDDSLVQPPKELTPLEKQAVELYETGLAMLNVTRPNKLEAYQMLQRAGELGHNQARVTVAWAQLLGSPNPQDIEAAKQAFQELVEFGVPDAHMGLGFLYATGIAVNASQARALVHYTFGAIGGSSWAQMALGYRYWSGVTVAASCEKALDFYRKVANKVAEEVSLSGGQAVQRVRLLEELENPGYNSGILDNDLIEYYQLLAEKGDVQAQGTDVLVLPLVILGVVSVVGGLSGLRLPETLHHRLPQTVEDGEEFGKDWTLAECLRCIPVRPSVSGSYEGLSDDRHSLEMSSQKPAENEIRFQDEATPFGKDSAVRMSKRIPRLVHQSSTMESPVDTCGAMKMTYWF